MTNKWRKTAKNWQRAEQVQPKASKKSVKPRLSAREIRRRDRKK